MATHAGPSQTIHFRQNFAYQSWKDRQIRCAGSGAPDLDAILHMYDQPLSERYSWKLTDDTAPLECAEMIEKLMAWEMIGKSADRWGGCLEGMFRQSGKLCRLERVMHSFSYTERTSAGVTLEPFYYSQTRFYRNDSLILHEATVLAEAGKERNVLCKLHQIPPLDWDGTQESLTLERFLFDDQTVELHVHTFVIRDDVINADMVHQIAFHQDIVRGNVSLIIGEQRNTLAVSPEMETALRNEILHFFDNLPPHVVPAN